MRLTLKLTLCLLLTIGLFSCLTVTDHKHKTKEDKGFEETAFIPCCGEPAPDTEPLTLKIAVNDTYCKATACVCIHNVAAREYEDLQRLLKEQHNINLEITYFEEIYHLEDKIKAKEFDGVICKPWNVYMLSKANRLNYERVTDIKDAFNNQWLKGVFMVPKDSPIQSMEDINGKVLVIGEKDAYEKYHQPMTILDEKGIQPAKIYHKSSCLECINELMDKNAEVAVVSDYVMEASCAVDVANPDDYRIIGETSETPLTSLIIDRDKVSKENAMRLQKALLSLSNENSPETMLSDGFVKPALWTPVPFQKVQ
ncbi:MAG: phosphate/phosphite/phosphonate ABC transporter substrate-binding protein [Carboxylicivirga sp.]|jgi:ABC-type phosphate/phosphonate transport system substrate-binding protein|nr:phosphate/phosphite/phosphonate ABC transporter substrate-binding protein [Carboxylicivirga sp.]